MSRKDKKVLNIKALDEQMGFLMTGIGKDVDAAIEETDGLGTDIATSACQTIADSWNLYDKDGKYPEWLYWVVVGVLKKKGITKL